MTYNEIVAQLRHEGYCEAAKVLDILAELPVVKIGDPLYWVCLPEDVDDPEDVGVHENGVVENIAWDGKNLGTFEEGCFEPFGSQFAFLSREEAELWFLKQTRIKP